ncbi:MAG TPA: multidrug efflux RND transporter permease subunit [Candidatus Dormibacteraeota bacterium]|nr:multidrug efflux RND transporter permease subunit [Candidatus Dormibacteraeota bacterium]
MFVDFFIRRPIFATVCALLIILGGAISIPSLPIAQFPNLAPPQVVVSSFYIGANAQTVESAVTIPLEQTINGVPGMKYITSTSGNDGSSQITITFDVTRDVDLASVDVQNRVNQGLGRLPNQVKNTGVIITKQTSGFLFGAGVYADGGQYDSLFLSNYLDIYVKDAIKRVPGVGEVFIFGERKYAMRLWLDPPRMAQRGLTATNVLNALQEQNVQVAAGQIGVAPIPAGQSFQISVRAIGRLSEPSEFENIILKTGTDGTLVRIKDVGRAELGAETYGSILRYNGHDAVGMGVTQLPGANALDVDRAAKAELLRLAKTFPPGLKYAVAFDTTSVIGESIRDVLITLLQAIVLVVFVIFIFLQEWRSTLIPAITIPVSLIGTFIFVKLLGFSINTLTLFGITLATGLVVDDAIVVIENVERHIAEGITEPHNAASVAMKEVAGAVIATSLVLVSVFVPVALFPGTTGILFRQFALTIAFSVAISAFNALTLTPALSALLLGHHRERAQGRFFRAFNRVVESGTNFYRRTLRRTINWRFAALAAFAATLALTYWIYQSVPRAFIPEDDEGYLIFIVQSPQGASLEYTRDICARVEQALTSVPEINGAFSIAGFSFSGSAPNRGMIFANLKPFEQRKGKQHSSAAVIQRIRGQMFAIPGALVIPFNPPAVQGLGAFGGFQFELEDLGRNSLQALADTANQLVAQGNSSKGLTGLFTSFTANDPQYLVRVDREKAKSLQVPLSQITDALQVYMGSVYVNDFDFNNRSYRVYVQADGKFRTQAKDIAQYYLRSDLGKMIPLDNLVTIEQSANPQVISHYNLFRSAEINGSAAPGRSSGEGIADMQALAKKVLPNGMTYEWSGLSVEELESAGKAVILFALGLVVVYLTLAAQYESFVLPFIVLLAVPVAILGAVGAQFLRGLQNDVYCQIGLVMLIGLSSKNAILIVEFAEQLREKGMSIVDAAIEAARIRLRPILMTSLAFILGVVPLVLARGAGRAGRVSVGTTVFGGMIAATTLNLVFIPVLYVLVKSVVPGRKSHLAAAPDSIATADFKN